jgi:hypothetical protein
LDLPKEVLQILGVESLEQLSLEKREAIRKQVTEPLWRAGNLRYQWHGVQLKIDAAIEASSSRQAFVCVSRRVGKSTYLLSKAFGLCLRKPGARVLYLAPTGRDAQIITTDTAQFLLQDCPEDIKPEYRYQDREFRFKNGSVIRVRGVNAEHADSLRGGSADLAILDEAGQMDQLSYLTTSVVMPMVLTTGGRIIFATTPPTTPGHDSASIFNKLANLGATSTFTIREDVPHISRAAKKEMLIEVGEDPTKVDDILDGKLEPETTAAQREFFCRFVTDANLAVVPEWPAYRSELIRIQERPTHLATYTSIDPGSKDNTGILYGYHDFLANRLVIEDEDLLQNPNTRKIADVIRTKETATWGGFGVYKRVSDIELRLIRDLRDEFGLDVSPARKDDMMASVHQLRHLVTSKRLVIHPRCVNLDRQLGNAIWNKRASDMERAGEGSIDGHFDLVASLRYMIRAVDWGRNPYPGNWTQPGMPHGPPANAWISPKSRTPPSKRNITGSTPTAKRIIAARKKRWLKR